MVSYLSVRYTRHNQLFIQRVNPTSQSVYQPTDYPSRRQWKAMPQLPLSNTQYSHSRGGKVGVLILQTAIKGQTPLVPVVAEQRCQRENFTDGEARPHRATFPVTTQPYLCHLQPYSHLYPGCLSHHTPPLGVY